MAGTGSTLSGVTSVVCVIPARGGSKGIPKKNLQLLGGIPLIERAIRTVDQSGVADEIIVSTDDDEIAGIASVAGARIVRRPPELATDEASSEGALLHALAEAGVSDGNLLFVQTTTPLLQPVDLHNLRTAHQGFDTTITVTASHAYLWRLTPEGSIASVNHDSQNRLRRQDLGSVEFVENGAAQLLDVRGFLRAGRRFFGRIGYSVMPKLRSVEIDAYDDLLLARAVHAMTSDARGASE